MWGAETEIPEAAVRGAPGMLRSPFPVCFPSSPPGLGGLSAWAKVV